MRSGKIDVQRVHRYVVNKEIVENLVKALDDQIDPSTVIAMEVAEGRASIITAERHA